MSSTHNIRVQVNVAEIQSVKVNLKRIDEPASLSVTPPAPVLFPTFKIIPPVTEREPAPNLTPNPVTPTPTLSLPLRPVTPILEPVASKSQPLSIPSTPGIMPHEAISLKQMKELRIYLTRIEDEPKKTLSRVPIRLNDLCDKMGKMVNQRIAAGVGVEMQKQAVLSRISKLKKTSYFCKVCGKKFYSASGYRRHHKKHLLPSASFASPSPPSPPPQQAEAEHSKPFACPRCDEKFATKTEIINHVQAHYNDIVRIKKEAASVPDEHEDDLDTFNMTADGDPIVIKLELDAQQDFANLNEGEDFPVPILNKSPAGKHSAKTRYHPCKYCRKVFTTVHILRSHIKNQHPGEPQIILSYTCETCGHVFESQKELRLHTRVYTGKITHSCEYCRKRFCTVYNLRWHIRKIHPEHAQSLNATCEVCGLEFSSDRVLKLHSRVHTGEKISCCKFCTATFSDKKSFIKHVNKKHPEQSCTLGYPCEFCGKLFENQLRLKLHKRTHTGSHMFACTLCESAFTLSNNLRNHIKKMHPEQEMVYTCGVCGKHFQNQLRLRMHARIHSGKNMIPCKFCESAFPSRNYLRAHMKKMHREESSHLTYSCETCESHFDNWFKFQLHQKIHTEGKKIHSCKYCDNFFGSKLAFQSHMMKMHPELAQLTYPCEACNLAFPSEYSLRLHKRIHGGASVFPCKLCTSIFRDIYNLRSHMRAAHPGEELPGIPSVCHTCGLKFSNREKLKLHQQLAHPRPVQTSSQKSLSCKICATPFTNPLSLRNHMRNVHHSTSSTPLPNITLPCRKCGKRFHNQLDLKIHQRVHAGNDALTCKLCPSFFKDVALLRAHIKKVHPNQGPTYFMWPCKTCGLEFQNRFKLKLHSRIHTGDKNVFPCNICALTFIGASNLQSHMKNVHPDPIAFFSQRVHRMSTRQKFDLPSPAIEKIHSCRLCGCSFAFEMSLNQHIRAEHPEHITRCVEPEEPPDKDNGNVKAEIRDDQVFIEPGKKKIIDEYLSLVDQFLFSNLPTKPNKAQKGKTVLNADPMSDSSSAFHDLNSGASTSEECIRNVNLMKYESNLGLDYDCFGSSAIELCETVFTTHGECADSSEHKAKGCRFVDLPLD